MPKARLDYELLESIAPRRPFFKGRVVGVQGQPCEGVFIIGEGQVLLSRAQHGGDDYALHLLGPGDVFGEGALTRILNVRDRRRCVTHRLHERFRRRREERRNEIQERQEPACGEHEDDERNPFERALHRTAAGVAVPAFPA